MRIRVFALVTGVVMLLCAACAPGAAGTSGSVSPDQIAAGGELYGRRCAGCHGAEGGGGERGPAHAGNPDLAYADYVADRILYGYNRMPSYRGRFSDEEIANVATYIRNSWGNSFGAVSTERVAARR